MLARTLGELLAEAEVVVPAHGRERRDVRGCQPSEHVFQIARVGELNDVAEQQDQIYLRLREPLERGSVRRSRRSGSKTLIQREPAGSSSQWRSLRTPMRTEIGSR